MYRVLFCIIFSGLILFLFIEKTNRLTELKLEIPLIEKETKRIERENEKIVFQLNQFSHPTHLYQLLGKPEFAHLKFPKLDEVDE